MNRQRKSIHGAPASVPARHWSTDEVRGPAFSYWVDAVCERFLELEIDSPVREHFHARLDQTELGPATANWLCADAQRVRRTRARVAGAEPGFLLMQLRAGRVEIRQAGRITHLHPGECILLDGARPYEVECPEATRSCVLQFSDEWLERWVSSPERIAPRHFRAVGWSGALCAAVADLEVGSCDRLALPRAEVADHIAALLSLALGPEPRDRAQGERLRERLMITVRNGLSDPDLSPTTVAAEHGISVRTLHYAFAAAGTSFVEELIQARLIRGRDLLTDPGLRQIPVIEVAARCGFTDPSHFARRFRSRFGVAPLAFRRASGTTH